MTLKTVFKALVYVFAVIGFVLVAGYFAVLFGWTNTKGVIDVQTDEFRKLSLSGGETEVGPWGEGEEWQSFTTAIRNDVDSLKKTEESTGVDARVIMSIIAVEQLRMYYSDRDTFKEMFIPLKVLGTGTQFSWGIAGIKEETAIEIEEYLKNKDSLYYPGEEYENLLDFKTENISEERYTRLTNPNDRSYQYLYTALFVKEIAAGWKKAGFDIGKRPEILATLFNIGFANSRPNKDPKMGGGEFDIQNRTYSFGRLAGEIYYSTELTDVFPR